MGAECSRADCNTTGAAETAEVMTPPDQGVLALRRPSLRGTAVPVGRAASEGTVPPSRGKQTNSWQAPSDKDTTFEEEGGGQEVVLAWTLTPHAQATAVTKSLLKLHDHIETCCTLFGAEILMEEATSGLICAKDFERMTAADTAVRLGQLMCRWAATMRMGICIGVHIGRLRILQLPSKRGQPTWFGGACAEALQLAQMYGKEWNVHMSRDVKERLSVLRQVRVQIAPRHTSYYLDAATGVGNFFESSVHSDHAAQAKAETLGMSLSDSRKREQSTMTRASMSIDEFTQLLKTNGVDVSKFGQFPVKPLKDFYNAVVQEQKSTLIQQGGKLERVVNLVRISLRIRDKENKLRELRISSEKEGSNMRERNQPLAVVLKLPESGQWQEAVENCFEQKLKLPAKVQRACFVTDMESYAYTEERSYSETIPDIMTTYKSHNIVINIKDKGNKLLQPLGLPEGKHFTVDTDGQAKTWMWALVGNNKEDQLMSLLGKNGIDVSEFAPQAFQELYDEIYERGASTLEVQNDVLVRTIRILKLWVHADILNVDHVLSVKAKFQKGQFDAIDRDRPISMRMSVDQDWEEAVEEALQTRLGLSQTFQSDCMDIDQATHSISEEVGFSKSYPGLRTLYVVNEVSVRVKNTQTETCSLVGLPAGTDFTFSRRENVKGPGTEDTVVTHWCWKVWEDVKAQEHKYMGETAKPGMVDGGAAEPTQHEEILTSVFVSQEEVLKSRVPSPKALNVDTVQKDNSSIAAVSALMKGKKTDFARAMTCAKRIRDKDYTAKNFFDDIMASFPELRLYCVQSGSTGGEGSTSATTSGRTADDEYQRTIGALFGVFWLMRLDINGRESFCFGLDNTWAPRTQDGGARAPEEVTKRKNFYDNFDWRMLRNLVIDAGLIRGDGEQLMHDPERTLAMLVLMAIHDIMKLAPLLPKVSDQVKEFCGYKAGETINDHDVALSYILIHHPQVLPSFAGLNKEQQDSVRFTHSKMEYNMGWLVQAEAPPGALFRTMRKVVMAGNAAERDVAFYFVHWFCDLAAAEPCPMEGMDKFVLKFPMRVLQQFLDSFGLVQTLSKEKTETQVLEEYLMERWWRHDPPLGAAPSGPGAVARMRLTLMAQGDSVEILKQFDSLADDDKITLAEEMAITGCQDQFFQRDPLIGSTASGKGPAILVYYAPALMQKAGRSNPHQAMMVLAEVFQKTRELWPLSQEKVNDTVSIRIDSLKELDCHSIFNPEPGFSWVLGMTSGKDAMVKLTPVNTFKDLNWEKHVVLSFGKKSARKKRRRFTGLLSQLPRVPRFSFSRSTDNMLGREPSK